MEMAADFGAGYWSGGGLWVTQDRESLLSSFLGAHRKGILSCAATVALKEVGCALQRGFKTFLCVLQPWHMSIEYGKVITVSVA